MLFKSSRHVSCSHDLPANSIHAQFQHFEFLIWNYHPTNVWYLVWFYSFSNHTKLGHHHHQCNIWKSNLSQLEVVIFSFYVGQFAAPLLVMVVRAKWVSVCTKLRKTNEKKRNCLCLAINHTRKKYANVLFIIELDALNQNNGQTLARAQEWHFM